MTFTATRFTFFSGSHATQLGEYAATTAAMRCSNSGMTGPALQLTYSPTTNRTPTIVQYSLAGNTLTLDYGGPCDAPVDTYVRVQ